MKKNWFQPLITMALIAISAGPALAGNDEKSYWLPLSDSMVFTLFIFISVLLLMVIYAQVLGIKGLLANKELWMSKDKEKESSDNGNGGKIASVALLLFLMGQNDVFAQGATTEPFVKMTDQLYWILIGFNAFLLGVVVALYYTYKGLERNFRGVAEEDTLSQLSHALTDAVPIEEEGSIMLDHDYDGIKELDNNLPPWWVYGFYVTIAFSVVYLVYFHMMGGDLQLDEYNKEMAVAEAEKAAFMETEAIAVDESALEMLTGATELANGKQVYVNNCQVCHGTAGEGVVGPNLTDEYWKHGGGITNIYMTIKTGVPDKGMIAWESMLTPIQIQEVSSYIMSLEGTNPPNAKAPEGDKWVPEN